MSEAVLQNIVACEWDTTNFLIISGNVFDPFIYYSHLVPLVTSLLIGWFIFSKNRTLLVNQILFILTNLFAAWVFFDLILWATDRPTYTIFFWSLVNLIEPFIYVFALYFVQVFISGKDTSLRNKIIVFAPTIPVIVYAFTNLNLLGFNLANCDREAIEGLLAHYIYIIEVIYVIGIALHSLHHFVFKSKEKRVQILLVTLSILCFLLAFSWGNIVGSLTDSWRVSQWGLFGMPVFITVLAYLIIKYNAFDIKVISTQILVTAFPILVGSQYFLTESKGSKLITIITFILSIFAGILIFRNVKKEIEQRKEIERLAEDLRVANEGQTNLIHIINHQVKGYIAKGRNIFAELGTDSYGKIPEQAKVLLKEGLNSLTEAVSFVQQILNASNVERGTMTYTMKPFDFKAVFSEIAEKQKTSAEQKGLEFSFEIGEGEYTLNGDESQLKEAVRNLIDNSINYTPKGKVEVSLEKKGNNILLTVKDTGIGINEEDKKRLFTKGGRGKDSLRVNVNSTGYGLSFVKGVVVAHKGRVWAESDGPGKGSTFFMELPV